MTFRRDGGDAAFRRLSGDGRRGGLAEPEELLENVAIVDRGNVISWKFEGYPPTALYRTGWKRDVTMRPGDRVTVFGWRSRDDTNLAHSREITFSDGKKLFFGPPAGTGDGGATPAVKVP